MSAQGRLLTPGTSPGKVPTHSTVTDCEPATEWAAWSVHAMSVIGYVNRHSFACQCTRLSRYFRVRALAPAPGRQKRIFP